MAKNWWDVEDPKDFFGVQGERTDEQKARVKQFRQEWGNVRGAAAVNGLVDGTYTADQLSQNWGAENLASVIRAETFEVGEFNEGDNFGSYLQSEFDNVSSFINPSGEGVRGTLGTIDTALAQGSGGPKGAERGVTVTAGDLASSSYMDAVRSAAETAGVDIYVDGPAGGQYELNVGQYDDVPLGSYHTVRESDSPLEMIFEAVLKQVVISVITGGLATDLQALGTHLSSSGAVATAEAAATGADIAYETKEWASTLGDILTTVGEGLEAGGAISSGTAAAAGGGIPPYVMTLIKNTASNEGVISDVIEVVDVINTAASAVESEEIPEAVIQEEEEVSLEADPDLMGTATIEETIGDEDFTTAPLPTPEIIVDEVPIDEIPIEITEPEVEFVDPSTDSGGGGGGGEESGGDSSAGAGTTATTGGTEAAGGSDGDPVITRDVEAVDDDPLIVNEGDIVGRQIKEAYEAETNPELKEALKEELIAWLEGGAGEPEPIPTTEQPPESTFEPNAGVSGDTAEGEDDFSVVGDLLNIPIDTPESTVPEDVDTSGVTGDTGDAGGAVDGGGAGTDGDGVDTGDGGEAGGGDSAGVADGSGAGTGEGTGEGSGTGEGTGEGEGSGTGGGSGGMLSDSSGQGYMGGFNYNLPQFVPVAYQPKDYDVELNRIIKQSLFQGMV